MTYTMPTPTTANAGIPVPPCDSARTVGVGRVLATREIQVNGRSVLVIVGEPQRLPSTATGLGYVCRLQIVGLQPTPVGIQATGPELAQALMSGLVEVSARLCVTITDLLSEAHIGGVGVLAPDRA